ncbi:MAG: FecCD family ABC transporter permease [Flavobacteriaceae bacterium]
MSFPSTRSTRLALTVIALIGAALLSLAVGPAHLSPGELSRGIWGADETARIILIELRLPRTLLALVIGGGLGLAGAGLQGFLRNPLAAPDLVGASNAAAFGAVAMLATGAANALSWLLPVAAIAGSLLAVSGVIVAAGRDPRILTVVLAGLAVSALGAALVALTLNLAPNDFAALEIAFWLLGSLTDRSFVHIAISLPPILIGAVLILRRGAMLDALSLGEETARSLGFNIGREQMLLVVGVALISGASVAVAGVIGFVGLVAPHLARPFVGSRPAAVLLPSAAAGALMLTCADIGLRLLPSLDEIRLGVITALLGAPFFFLLVLRERRSMRWG